MLLQRKKKNKQTSDNHGPLYINLLTMTCTITPLKLNAVTSRLRFTVSLIPHPFWKVQYIQNVMYADKLQFTIRLGFWSCCWI